MGRRIVGVKVLPGEPVDGSGRRCIHLFVQDERGPFVEPHVLHPALDAEGRVVKQRVVARPTRGRLACSPTRPVAPVTRGNVVNITDRTDDVRAVTCPACIASPHYARLVERLAATEAAR